VKVLVTGAGGFIGGHVVKRLVADGHEVTAVDLKPEGEWWQRGARWEWRADLRDPHMARKLCKGIDHVYNLAADMGGMGFIESHKAACMESVLISTNMLRAARDQGVARFFFSSSACVYSAQWQVRTTERSLDIDREYAVSLAEADVEPYDPEDGYGWEKLFSERMCRHFFEDYGLETRVGRLHNVYGPHGTWTGGREKAPAAICRKVAHWTLDGGFPVEIWGDGQQTRSFTYVDDCIEGIIRLMGSDCREPLNIGSDELVTIDDLLGAVEKAAGLKAAAVSCYYEASAPQGVRGRCSDNTKIKAELGWAPSTRLADGLVPTYAWVKDQVVASEALRA
jgi:nucleoside-diphosphate-sugar epimerase